MLIMRWTPKQFFHSLAKLASSLWRWTTFPIVTASKLTNNQPMILLLDACCFSWWLWRQWTLWLIAYCRLGLLISFLVTIFQFQFWYTGDWNISCVLCLWLSLLYPPGQGLFSVHLFQFQFGDQGDWNVSSVLCLWVLLLNLDLITVFSVFYP